MWTANELAPGALPERYDPREMRLEAPSVPFRRTSPADLREVARSNKRR
jgi:hypothetical protein